MLFYNKYWKEVRPLNATDKKESLWSMLLSIPSFWKAQMSDWKVTVVRTSLERLGYQIIYPYLSLYIVALGAQKTQLGIITSISMILAGLLGPVTGFFIDRNGAKKVYIAGILMLFASYMLYAAAPTWHLCVVAMIVYYLGSGTGGHSCGTICGNCLTNCDRAKGMLICESLAAGLLGMVGPMIAAFILVRVIGVNEAAAGADELKYLFYVSAFFTFVSLLVVIFKLSNQKWAVKNKLGSNAIQQGIQILKENKYARRWIIIGAINNLPTAMVLPYTQVFAGEVKGASVTILAAMVTACSLTSVFCGYPVGALADRFGRKKVMYVILPLYWLSNILLILAPSPAMLIVAGVLSGFYYISSPLSAAIQRELVSQEVMGTWLGVTRLTNAIVAAIMALLAGIIYDKIGPQYVFIIFVALDALVRMPLLASLPETLHLKKKEEDSCCS